MSVCRACDAPIVWAFAADGATISVDAEPTEHGDLILLREDGPAEMRGQTIIRARPPEMFDESQPLYTAHASTCPHEGREPSI